MSLYDHEPSDKLMIDIDSDTTNVANGATHGLLVTDEINIPDNNPDQRALLTNDRQALGHVHLVSAVQSPNNAPPPDHTPSPAQDERSAMISPQATPVPVANRGKNINRNSRWTPPYEEPFDISERNSPSEYLTKARWPLSDEEEAFLLRYFVERLARNFDLTDPVAHFRKVVPQRAATCPTLLNAVLAHTARYLSQTTDYDPLISNKYQSECLQHLIPLLDDENSVLDENLLASTIILRALEEIEHPISGQSPSQKDSHLLGAHSFLTAQERAATAGGLRRAAFWVGLRQEIYIAVVNQRTILPPLEHCNVDRSSSPAGDNVWACRMVVLCTDVIRYCYGDSNAASKSSMERYDCLIDSISQWHELIPASFTPIFTRAAPLDFDSGNRHSGQVFPDIRFIADEVVVGWLHYHISLILLAAHNPRIPRLGPGRAAAVRAADEEIMGHVRVMCGIALSNSEVEPSLVYASMGVTMAGDKFTSRREQEALLDLLFRCEGLAWPTAQARANLKESWGWPEENVEAG